MNYAAVGVILTENLKNMSVNEFEFKLAQSMTVWREESRVGIWLRIGIEDSSLIPVAVAQGFWFHHCSGDYILLCNWLPGGKSASRLPPSPSHYIGVAGFVLNSRREILMVQERSGPAAGIGLWKLPGGLCDVGEDIHRGKPILFSFLSIYSLINSSAVAREIKEETGLDSTFLSLAAIMEGHKGQGPTRENASDLYCVCVLKVNDESQPLKKQELELEDCAWIPVEQALSHHPILSPETAFGKVYRSALSIALKYQNIQDKETESSDSSQSNHVSGLSLGLTQSIYPLGIGKRLSNVLLTTFSEEDK